MENAEKIADDLDQIAKRLEFKLVSLRLEIEDYPWDLDESVIELEELADEIRQDDKLADKRVYLGEFTVVSPRPALCWSCGDKFYHTTGHSCGSLKTRGDVKS